MFFVEVVWDIERDEIVGKGEFKCGDNYNPNYRFYNEI